MIYFLKTWEGGDILTALSSKALEILQGIDQTEFTNSDLTNNGFSKGEAQLAIKELEDECYIYIIGHYLTGNVTFKLS